LGKRSIAADTALRLAKAFGTSIQSWMGLQDEYDLREARVIIANQLDRIQRLAA
jgi:addiction module HigA family antidote